MNKAQQLIASLPMIKLIESFELTNSLKTEEAPLVRGWLMDELEARNPTAFELFLDSIADSPREFYI